MIIDFNAHFLRKRGLSQSDSGVDCPLFRCSTFWRDADELVAIEKAAGIDLAVVSDLATAFHNASLEGGPLPDNLIQFASLSPTFESHALPIVKGLRIYPTYHTWDFDGDATTKLLSLARERNLILQIYLRLRDPRALPLTVGLVEVIKQTQKLTDTCEDMRFVVSGASYAEIKANPALFGQQNVWTDISHVQHPTNSLPKLLELIDSTRVLFGSGAPVLYPYSNVYRVINSPISDEVRERVLWRNAQELL